MSEFAEKLRDNPIIAAAFDAPKLELALSSPCGVVFVLFGSLMTMTEAVERGHRAGKLVMLHADLVDGLSGREAAIDILAKYARPDGIISTKPALIRRAKAHGLYTIQRIFALDSISVEAIPGQLASSRPDYAEILHGLMPRVISGVGAMTDTPIIAGGLIKQKKEAIAALAAGAVAISTSDSSIWEM